MKKYIIFICVFFSVLLFAVLPVRQIYGLFKYHIIIKKYAAKYDLDWFLVSSLIYYESRFRSNALSPKGACGLMQIMPSTAQAEAAKMGWGKVEHRDLFKPKINIELGCLHLRDILREFNGDTKLALVAYNAGSGSVYKWYRQAGAFHKGRLRYTDISSYIYPETSAYVDKVYNSYMFLKRIDWIKWI